MTDVEAKTPPKRKSISNTENKKSGPKFAKKPKLENAKTPQKSNFTKQKNKKNKNGSTDDSPKKMKPFGGTKTIVASEKGEEKKKRKRSNQLQTLELKIKTNKDEALEKIEGKIQEIQSRKELSKTAKRKLKILQRLKKIANGVPLGQPQQQKAPHSKSEATKRRERKKNAKNLVAGSNLQKTSEKDSQQSDVKTNGKANKNKKLLKIVPQVQIKEEDDSDEDVEDVEEEDQDSVDDEGESGEEEEQDDDSDDEAEAEEESDDDEEESEEESPPPPKIINLKNKPVNKKKQEVKKINTKKNKNDAKEDNTPDLPKLKENNLLDKNQKRYVLFVGNIPYDTNKLDLIEHFKKSGEIKHIRIPTEKKSSKPRGFAYVELANEESYQKCLSLHHTHLKGRRINVLYTQGGKKKGEDKKKEIKAKNFKLHAMRKQGKLAGSKKETQKRSFRRLKKKAGEPNEQEEI